VAAHTGTRAVVVLPEDASAAKAAAIEQQGASTVRYDRQVATRDDVVMGLSRSQGLTEVPSSDDWDVVYGQSTVVTEMLAEVPGMDVVLVPVGGGGLAAGSCLAARGAATRIIGVEPVAANDTARSLMVGARVTVPPPDTLADGLRHRTPSKIPFEVLADLLTDMIEVVTDSQIVHAMALLYESLGVISEPSGACAAAAALQIAPRLPRGSRVGVVVSGGNILPQEFTRLTQINLSSRRQAANF
jgi:threo-3-hydroxy-L-aspartate ammonia-lyase